MVTAETMRERLGLSRSDVSSDGVIAALIGEAHAFARLYCRMRPSETVPDALLARMVEEDWGRLEGAGVSARSVSGASEYYRSAYSDTVMAYLRALRHPASALTEDTGRC